MAGNTGQLKDDICSNLSELAASFDRASVWVFESEGIDEAKLRAHLADAGAQDASARNRMTAANSDFDRWEREDAEAMPQLSRWKQLRQTDRLHARADRFERRAVLATEVALLAMMRAEHAIAHALLARLEAIAIQVERLEKP